jgi:hypothetical protein
MDENGLADWDHLERETVIEAAATKTFERLYALVKKGYRPEFQESFLGAIWLTHPSKQWKHSLLFLYPNGLVVSSGNSDDFRFYRDHEDEPKFQKFLRSVPQPTLWDRTRDWRRKTAAWAFIVTVTFGPVCLIFILKLLFGSGSE